MYSYCFYVVILFSLSIVLIELLSVHSVVVVLFLSSLVLLSVSLCL